MNVLSKQPTDSYVAITESELEHCVMGGTHPNPISIWVPHRIVISGLLKVSNGGQK